LIRSFMTAGLAAALALILGQTAMAEGLVSTLSDDAVQITSSFTGERIVVFGAVQAPTGNAEDYQIAVVVEGPQQDITVRRKGRVMGVWANVDARSFSSVPSFYVMHLSPGFLDRIDMEGFLQYRLGVKALPFVQAASVEQVSGRFAEALISLKTGQGLYDERRDEVTFVAPGVFRSTFFLPSAVPTGDYKVSVYLFRGAAFLAGQSQTLTVAKGGFSERIARAAQEHSLLYGLACVALALLTGWLAGIIFRRS